MTFFRVFDIPVFWPILLVYFFALLAATLNKQVRAGRLVRVCVPTALLRSHLVAPRDAVLAAALTPLVPMPLEPGPGRGVVEQRLLALPEVAPLVALTRLARHAPPHPPRSRRSRT